MHYEKIALEQIQLSQKQIQILEAYLKLCERLGVEQITMHKVAKAAKVSLGIVHYHFNGKNGPTLLEAAIRYVDQESIRFINYELEKVSLNNNFSGIDDYIKILFQWIKTKSHHSKFYLYHYYHTAIHRSHDDLANFYIMLVIKRITSLLYVGIGCDFYPKLEQVDELAQDLHAQITGSLILAAYDPRKDALAFYRSNAIRACDRLIKSHTVSSRTV
ncbi:MAG: TetR family transcriptional regulator [Bdellovibrio sp.]|nr:TetR family transcriptional regulator [Bdellovibrio sp.]